MLKSIVIISFMIMAQISLASTRSVNYKLNCVDQRGRSADHIAAAALRGNVDQNTKKFDAQSVYFEHIDAKWGGNIIMEELLYDDQFQPRKFLAAESREGSGYKFRVDKKTFVTQIAFYHFKTEKEYILTCNL